MYRLTESGAIRLADGAAIPDDPRNGDWQAFLSWVALGGRPQPQVPVADVKPRDLLAELDTMRGELEDKGVIQRRAAPAKR